MTRRNLLKSAALLPLCWTDLARAQQGNIPVDSNGEKALESYVRSFIHETGLPGVWIGVADQGRVLGTACAGYADIEDGRSAQLEDRVRLGSISKPVAATVYAALAEEGTVGFDTQLKHLRSLRGLLPDEVGNITAQSLVTHTSGLASDVPSQPDGSLLARQDYVSLRHQALLDICKIPLKNPGHENYSGGGFVALGVIMDELAGVPFEMSLSRFTKRLGLSTFGVGEPQVGNTTPYDWTGKGAVRCKGRPNPGYQYNPAGSIHATIEDLTTFGLGHALGKFRRPLFQNGDSLPKLHEIIPGSTRTLTSWERESHDDGSYVLCHTGLMSLGRGDTSIIYIAPRRGFVVAACTNGFASGKLSTIKALRDRLANPIYHVIND